jgi:peroxiredoxin
MPTQSRPGEIDSKIIDFTLPATDGRDYCSSDFDDKDLLVIIFKCNHCPYVKAVVSRLIELQSKYSGKGVQFVGINPNDAETYPEDSFDNMKLFVKERGINFPYLYDESQEVAKAYDAVCTPDIYVYDKVRNLRYRGRLDDNWKDETAVKSKDLEKAIEQLLAGKDIDFPQIPSMGCSIKWKS